MSPSLGRYWAWDGQMELAADLHFTPSGWYALLLAVCTSVACSVLFGGLLGAKHILDAAKRRSLEPELSEEVRRSQRISRAAVHELVQTVAHDPTSPTAPRLSRASSSSSGVWRIGKCAPIRRSVRRGLSLDAASFSMGRHLAPPRLARCCRVCT